VTKNNPDDPRRGGWRTAIFVWATVALILGSTYALVFVRGMAPHEWAAEITFVVAHLVAAEVLVSGHRWG
jgi:hypothetical protein